GRLKTLQPSGGETKHRDTRPRRLTVLLGSLWCALSPRPTLGVFHPSLNVPSPENVVLTSRSRTDQLLQDGAADETGMLPKESPLSLTGSRLGHVVRRCSSGPPPPPLSVRWRRLGHLEQDDGRLGPQGSRAHHVVGARGRRRALGLRNLAHGTYGEMLEPAGGHAGFHPAARSVVQGEAKQHASRVA